jgi:glutamate synthase domain-containing protein 3
MTYSAGVLHYKDLNADLRNKFDGESEIRVDGVLGQRYMGSALKAGSVLKIYGTPGNDLGCYNDGGYIEVFGNAQDGTANTMNDGSIVIHGNSGDAAGYAMRGGDLYIKGNTGYRSGIHMKEYTGKVPKVVIGGTAGDFLGEYMAGGVILVLNLENAAEAVGRYCATGMHGGRIYIRGSAAPVGLKKGIEVMPAGMIELEQIADMVKRYGELFDTDVQSLLNDPYSVLYAKSSRPYGNMYVGA